MARHNGGFKNQSQANGNNNNSRQWMNHNGNNNRQRNSNNSNNSNNNNNNNNNSNNNRHRNNNSGHRNQPNQQTHNTKPCRYGLQCTGILNGKCTFVHPNNGEVNHSNNQFLGNQYVRNNEFCPRGNTCFAQQMGNCNLFHPNVADLGTTQVWEFGECNPTPASFDNHTNQGRPATRLVTEHVGAFGTRPCCAKFPSGILVDEDGDVVMCDCTSKILTTSCFYNWYLRSQEAQKQLKRDYEMLTQELLEYKLNNPNSWSKEEAFQRMSVELRNYVADKYVEHMQAENSQRKRKLGTRNW